MSFGSSFFLRTLFPLKSRITKSTLVWKQTANLGFGHLQEGQKPSQRPNDRRNQRRQQQQQQQQPSQTAQEQADGADPSASGDAGSNHIITMLYNAALHKAAAAGKCCFSDMLLSTLC